MRGQAADASFKNSDTVFFFFLTKKNHRPAKIKQNSFHTDQTLKRAIN